MLVGIRVNASMLLGMILSWIIAPYALLHYGVLHPNFTKNDVLLWVMWPATGMMVSAGLVRSRAPVEDSGENISKPFQHEGHQR